MQDGILLQANEICGLWELLYAAIEVWHSKPAIATDKNTCLGIDFPVFFQERLDKLGSTIPTVHIAFPELRFQQVPVVSIVTKNRMVAHRLIMVDIFAAFLFSKSVQDGGVDIEDNIRGHLDFVCLFAKMLQGKIEFY